MYARYPPIQTPGLGLNEGGQDGQAPGSGNHRGGNRSPDRSPRGIHPLMGPVTRMGGRVHRGDEVVSIGDSQEKKRQNRHDAGDNGDGRRKSGQNGRVRESRRKGRARAGVPSGSRSEKGIKDATGEQSRGRGELERYNRGEINRPPHPAQAVQ